MKINTPVIWLFLLLLPCFLPGQQPLNFGATYSLYSQVLQEKRQLNVLLPAAYTTAPAESFPVIYLLDGAADEDFFHTAGLLRYLDDHDMMPPTILVGIANVDRKRDFTYPSTDPRDVRDFPTTGGSANFIRFLQQELTAYVDSTFRTNGHRTLVGQSLGGLLATEILLRHPGVYNDYVIVSPSLWWDSTRLYQQTQLLHDQLEVFPDRLFVSVGEEYPVMMEGSRLLASAFHNGEESTEVTFLPLLDEDHNTILHEALYRAFDGWYDPTVLYPYHFANAWNGLNVRSAPNLDSAIVGKLAYGASLGVISAAAGNEAEIDGLPGSWVYVGSDLGRGWVFDAYVAPIKPFTEGVSLKQFALVELGLPELINYRGYPTFGEEMHDMIIYGRAEGPQFIEHARYEFPSCELKIPGLNLGQALMMTKSFLRSQGAEQEISIEEQWPDQFYFTPLGSRKNIPENCEIRYLNRTLSISVGKPYGED